ncbi:MAG: MlaD family protein [Lentisphaeria bacterium]|nr:MlaD family protein [Lentisphaeria bacterium]
MPKDEDKIAEGSFPNPEVHEKRNFPLVWIVPFIAILIGFGMLFYHWQTQGVLVEVSFLNGKGIVGGKTKIMYQGVQVGKVEQLKLNTDGVTVTAFLRIDRQYKHFAKSETKFWLVKPRISASSIEGLDTILSGQYITFLPGDGKPTFKFTGLENIPLSNENSPGLRIILQSDSLDGISEGSPLYFRKIQVGKVERYELDEVSNKVKIFAYIEKEYKSFVRQDTRFWNISGVKINAGLNGVKIKTGTVASMLDGGIAFDYPYDYSVSPPAQDRHTFELHKDENVAMSTGVEVTFVVRTAEGLEVGTRVMIRGIVAGHVKEVNPKEDLSFVHLKLLLKEKYRNKLGKGAQFYVARPKMGVNGISDLDTIIKGSYIKFIPGEEGQAESIFKDISEVDDADYASGLRIFLKTPVSPTVSSATPIVYKQYTIGQVMETKMDPVTQEILTEIQIFKRFIHLVNESTVFWDGSGLDIKASLSGVKIRSKSIRSILLGAIVAHTPDEHAKSVEEGQRFTLHRNKETALRKGKFFKLIFPDATHGIKETLSSIKYRNYEIGSVDKWNYDMENDEFSANIFIREPFCDLVSEDAYFWLVFPSLNVNGFQALDTIITGSYINLYPGKSKEEADTFVISYRPPLRVENGAKRIRLITGDLGGLKVGAPVSYRKITVGKVIHHELHQDRDQIYIDIAIKPQFKDLINSSSVFWRHQGVDIHASLADGVSMKISSLPVLMSGGIEFDTIEPNAKKIDSSTIFDLKDNYRIAGRNGKRIELELTDAEGIKAGSTKIIMKGVNVGFIEGFSFSKDFSKVIATAMISEYADLLTNEDTSFWKVTPDNSPIGTLFKKTSILVSPGNSQNEKLKFVVNDDPPFGDTSLAGLHLFLESDSLNGLSKGVPVLFRDLNVGKVLNFKLEEDRIVVHIWISDDYRHFVNNQSQFWMSGGITISGGIGGLQVQTKPLTSILRGGISFSSTTSKDAIPVKDKHTFNLYRSFSDLKQQTPGLVVRLKSDELGSLAPGNPVLYRQVQVGKVMGSGLSDDSNYVITDILIFQKYQHLIREKTVFWNASGIDFDWGLFSGAKLKTESLKALLAGGISLATPQESKAGEVVANKHLFELQTEFDEDWKSWQFTKP